MTLPRLALAVIGDEIGPSLAEMISFCAENNVRRLDMRTVDGRNLLGLGLDEVAAIAKTVRAAGIEMPTFVSPLLKWPAPGQTRKDGKVDFAFDPAECPAADPLAHGFEIADLLEASRLRVFTHLRYDGYRPADLDAPVARLIELAERHDKIVEIENYKGRAFPTLYWDLFGEKGQPVRTTVSEIGPVLMARLLQLNDVDRKSVV